MIYPMRDTDIVLNVLNYLNNVVLATKGMYAEWNARCALAARPLWRG